MQYRKRLAALRRLLKKEKLAALLVAVRESDSQNVRYLSGFSGTTGALAVGLLGAALAVDGRYTERAQSEARGVRIVNVVKPSKGGHLMAHAEAALAALGLKKGARVGIEGERVSVLTARAWEAELPQRLAPTRLLVERLRGVKDAAEARLLARACQATARAFADIEPRVRPGMREQDVADLVERAMKARGAIRPSFDTIVASGPNSAIPHHKTGARRLRAGEPVVIDFGGVFEGGYCSDMTRTVFVRGKKPAPELTAIYRIVHEANRRAADQLRPGMSWADYDAVARAYIKERGYGQYFSHGLGHSLGLEVHDPSDYQRTRIEKGAVLTDEPGIYVPGLGGVRIEDVLIVSKRGARRLTPLAPPVLG